MTMNTVWLDRVRRASPGRICCADRPALRVEAQVAG